MSSFLFFVIFLSSQFNNIGVIIPLLIDYINIRDNILSLIILFKINFHLLSPKFNLLLLFILCVEFYLALGFLLILIDVVVREGFLLSFKFSWKQIGNKFLPFLFILHSESVDIAKIKLLILFTFILLHIIDPFIWLYSVIVI